MLRRMNKKRKRSIDFLDDEQTELSSEAINEYLTFINDFIKNSINEGMNEFVEEIETTEVKADIEESKSDLDLSLDCSGRSNRFSSNYEDI